MSAKVIHLPDAKRGYLALMVATMVGLGMIGVQLGRDALLFPAMLFAVLGVLWGLVMWDRHAVVLGADGVLIRQGLTSSFLTYHSISEVRHLTPESREHVDPVWVVMLRVRHGGTFVIPTARSASADPVGKKIARRIHRAQKRADADGAFAHQADMLDRGKRSGRDWLKHLRDLKKRVGTPFRSELNAEQLWTMLRDDGARLSHRIAAAIVLDNQTATKRLSRVARRFANPKIKRRIADICDAMHEDEARLEAELTAIDQLGV